MKILRLKLVNFIGIQNGMGKSEIEIVFPQNGNAMTMFVGKNGSGKSTILSQLTPFKDSFDDRKNLIVPGKEGIKEIDIFHNGHTYKIKHVYGKTSSSFISEDDVELNEAGGVRTFEEVIKNKFKLDKEYFKIGKIGSNTTNFIQFTTAQRKAYISVFIEAIQKYLDAYDVVAKKVKEQENQIKQISNDLKKFDSGKVILDNITKAESNLTSLETEIQNITKREAEINMELKNINESLSKINYLDNKARLTDKEKLLKKNTIINESISNNFPEINIDNVDNKIDELKEIVNKENSSIQVLKGTLNSITANKIASDNELLKVKSKLSGLKEVDIKKYEDDINKLKQLIKSIDENIDSSKYGKNIFENISKTESYLTSFKTFMKIMLESYAILNANTIDPSHKNVELFFMKDFTETLGNYIKTINTNITDLENLLEEKQKVYSIKYANLSKLDILKKRPKDCKINSCPFIADALKYENLESELEKLDSEIKGIKTSIKDAKDKSDILSDLRITYSSVARSYRLLLARENIVYRNFIFGSHIAKIMEQPKNKVIELENSLINMTEDYIKKSLDVIEYKKRLDIKEAQYSQVKNSEDTRKYFLEQQENISKSIREYENQINSLTKQINDENYLYTKHYNELNSLISFKESLTDEKTIEDEIRILKEEITTYESLIKNRNSKNEDLKIIKSKLADSIKNKNQISTELTNLKAAEITVKNLNDNLTNINSVYTDTNIVKQALNPKSGIPLIFIQSYLDGTEAIANQLLNIAFNGKFEIKFMPTASDFFIQVRSGENVIEDIKLASQGEIALTTISISLALIERSLGEYNIVYLDEIDGPLDYKNRESFINIINKQIEKLNLEQIFIISHNNAFDNCKMNVVMLPGSETVKDSEDFMKNKNIVYDYSEE